MHPIIVKSRQVLVQTTPTGEVSAPAPVCGTGEPVARLLREGGVVYAIEVRCACGRPTVVQLDYEQTPSVPTSPPSEHSPEEEVE